MRRNFVEAGAASAVLTLSSEAGIPLAPTQADLTPFQRLVLLKELERQQPDTQNGASTPGQVNRLRQPRGGGLGGETVTYTNEHAS